MENLVLLNKNDLRELLIELIPTSAVVEPTKNENDYLPFDEALDYLNARGLEISKATLYKLTSTKQIPFQRWGGRKIVFVRGELDKWIETRLSCDEEKRTNRITNNVARSARKKEKR